MTILSPVFLVWSSCFPPSPLAATTYPFWYKKNYYLKVSGGWFAAKMSQPWGGGARPPRWRLLYPPQHPLQGLRKRNWVIWLGVTFRGAFCLWYFLNSYLGNYIKSQWGERKWVLGGFHPAGEGVGVAQIPFKSLFSWLCLTRCLRGSTSWIPASELPN